MSDVDDLRQVIRDLDGDVAVYLDTPDGARPIASIGPWGNHGVILRPVLTSGVLGEDTIERTTT